MLSLKLWGKLELLSESIGYPARATILHNFCHIPSVPEDTLLWLSYSPRNLGNLRSRLRYIWLFCPTLRSIAHTQWSKGCIQKSFRNFILHHLRYAQGTTTNSRRAGWALMHGWLTLYASHECVKRTIKHWFYLCYCSSSVNLKTKNVIVIWPKFLLNYDYSRPKILNYNYTYLKICN